MKPSNVEIVLTEAIIKKRNFFLFGQPGVGKTDLVHSSAQLASERLGEKVEVMTVITSLRDPTDGNGLACFVDHPALGKVVEFVPTHELARMILAKGITVVFLDELPNAILATQASYCNLIQSRKQNGHAISDKVVFIAAGNGREHRVGANQVSTALMNRFCKLTVDVDVNDFLLWGVRNNVHEDVLAWVKVRPQWLSAFKPEPDVQQPTPRSIANMAKYIDTNEDLHAWPVNVVQEVFSGYVGMDCARDFVGAREIAKQIPRLANIIAAPESVSVPDQPIAQHAVLNMIVRRVEMRDLAPCFTYVERFTPEFQRMFVSFLRERDPAYLESSAYIQWETSQRHAKGGV